MESSLTFLITTVILLPIVVMVSMMPYVTRRTESFGVSIPEDAYPSPQLARMRKQYALMTSVIGLATIAIFLSLGFLLTANNDAIAFLIIGSLFTLLISSFILYLYFHQKMKRLKEKEGWHRERPQVIVVDTTFRNQKLTVSNVWFAIPFLITLASLFMSVMWYDLIPDRIPMNYDLSGEVNRWADKSYRSVLALPMIQLYLTLLFVFINTLIAKSKQQLDAANPEKSLRQSIIFRRRWSGFVVATGTGLTLVFFLIQLSLIVPIQPQVLFYAPMIFAGATVIASLVLAVTTGQGGSRVTEVTSEAGEVINRDDDRYWKLGQFYYNPTDPALFLEKRFGIGWTINLARPAAWFIFIAIIGLAFAIPLLMIG